MTSKAVGIDLGTTFSSVAVFKNGRVEVISNNYGERLTPSCVSFTENGDTLVGKAALERICSNPTNTVFGIKRLIGCRITDSSVQADMQLWPFKIVSDAGEDKPLIEVTLGGEKKRFTVEDISSKVLAYLKKTAEKYLGDTVTEAVITIPANYGAAQRKATTNAAELAGFTNVHLLNEPTAAAIAYGTENLRGQNQTMMVFDMGGGTCDVSILDLTPGNEFKAKGTAGDMHLGGEDLDSCLMEHFANEFKEKHGKNLKDDKKAVWKLKTKCESAKRALSENDLYTLEIDSLFDGKDFMTKLRRDEFEQICKDIIDKVLLPIKEALKNAGLEKQAIDTVVLTGGSSRVPKIEQVVQEFFNGKQMSKSISPDEAIVWGAAIMAAQPNIHRDENVDDDVAYVVVLKDVLGVSLGIQERTDDMAFFLRQGTALPARKSKSMVTATNYQHVAEFRVYEGKDVKVTKNKYLGSFTIEDLPRKLKGEVKFDCVMEIDENGLLHVSAVETSTGRQNRITFSDYIA